MIFFILKVRKGSESEEKGERTGHLKYNQSLLFPFVYASSSKNISSGVSTLNLKTAIVSAFR